MWEYKTLIPEKKRTALIRQFVEDKTAAEAAYKAKVSRICANRWYRRFRELIYQHGLNAPRLRGEVEMDIYQLGVRKRRRYVMVEGKPVEKPVNKLDVFGIAQRGGRVYTHVIKRKDRRTLYPVVFLVVEPGSTIYSDSERSLSTLGTQGYSYYTTNHSKKVFARKQDGKDVHTGTIDAFWAFCEDRLSKFNGIHRTTAHLHLKECEFRWNHRAVGERDYGKRVDAIANALKALIREEDRRLAALVGTSTSGSAMRRIAPPRTSRIRRRARTDSAERVRQNPAS